MGTNNDYAGIVADLRTHRERQTEGKSAWIESFLIDVGNDLPGDINTNFITLSKISDPVTVSGTNTLSVVSNTGFTGKTHSIYEIEITKPGAKGTAEFKWKSKTYLQNIWGPYTTGIVSSSNSILDDGVAVDFTGVLSDLGDRYCIDACGSWHTPSNFVNSYVTSVHAHLYGTDASPKAGRIKLLNDCWTVWAMVDSVAAFPNWRTPVHLLGNPDAVQFRIEFAELTKGDIEYVSMTMKGWDE